MFDITARIVVVDRQDVNGDWDGMTKIPQPFGHIAYPMPLDLLFEAKLQPPPRRETWIPRPRLVAAMQRAERQTVTLLAAPAGYGKTTLAAQWLHANDRGAIAWVSLDVGDNDPGRLWTHVATALERAGCPLQVKEPAQWLDGGLSVAPLTLLPGIIQALAVMPDEVTLVLDDFHLIQAAGRHQEVELLLSTLPAHAHLVILSRSDPGLKLGRLRVSNELAELRAEHLAFTPDEAREMLVNEGVALSANTLALLLERAEGWPAALYLAALSLRGRPDPDTFVERFSGGNRFIGDYLTEEVINRNSERLREFLLGASVLDRFSAQLCNYVLERTDSAAVLQELERDNLFVVPLDEERCWFRFHNLFAAVARSELELTQPDHVSSLHARAAEWFAHEGHVSEAIGHWIAAGRHDEAAHVVQANWLQFCDGGRSDTVRGWLATLQTADAGPAAHLTAAWVAATVGDESALAECLARLDVLDQRVRLPDGSHSVESAVAQIRGLFGYGGPVEMLAGAQRAVELETDSYSPHFVIALLALGQALYIKGDLEEAIHPIRTASRSHAVPGLVRIVCLSMLSLIEHERGNMTPARVAAEQAVDVLEGRGLRASPQGSLALAALAQALAAADKADDAMDRLELGLAERFRSNAQAVWGPIFQLLISARVAAQLGHPELARDLLAQLSQRTSRFSDGMGSIHARVEAVERILVERASAEMIGDPLTKRELAIIRLLQGSLSLAEISSELYLSANTVKTHARNAYRKLGAHSRSEAVLIARQRSLI